MRRIVWLLLLLSLMAHAGDPGDDDAAALSLPSTPIGSGDVARAAALTIEGAETAAAQRGAGEINVQRVSLDARFDGSVARGWRAVLAERLDSDWQGAFTGNQEIGTLKEAYLSWQPRANLLIDAGRINARQGVAIGYNPTDFFKADAIRSLVSLDPNSLRENRLGTVMLRGQALWNGGALTAQYAPDLTDHTSSAALDPNLGATNSRGRWLVSLSQQLAQGWTPQWLAFGDEGRSAQLGLNVTALLGPGVVAYVEASAGRSTQLLAQAVNLPQRETMRARAATGLTYSLANKLSLTFEYEYNGAGLSASGWSAVQSGNPTVYGRYREFVLAQQDLPTQANALLYASWQDLIFRHLDLSAFLRVDLVDHSRLPWLELRRHWNAFDLSLRWQDSIGKPTSDFGASTQQQTWQLVLDYYL
jgi:hypothetical protein